MRKLVFTESVLFVNEGWAYLLKKMAFFSLHKYIRYGDADFDLRYAIKIGAPKDPYLSIAYYLCIFSASAEIDLCTVP